jgi:hypothetical protein
MLPLIVTDGRTVDTFPVTPYPRVSCEVVPSSGRPNAIQTPD